jgi:hypothetical protein
MQQHDMERAPAKVDARCGGAKSAVRLVAIVPIAPIHIGVGPVPAEIGLRREGNDSNAVGGYDRSKDDPADKVAIVGPAGPATHICPVVPVLVPVIVIMTPVLVPIVIIVVPILIVMAPIRVVIPILVVALAPIIIPVFVPILVVVIARIIIIVIARILIPVLVAVVVLLGDDDHAARS